MSVVLFGSSRLRFTPLVLTRQDATPKSDSTSVVMVTIISTMVPARFKSSVPHLSSTVLSATLCLRLSMEKLTIGLMSMRDLGLQRAPRLELRPTIQTNQPRPQPLLLTLRAPSLLLLLHPPQYLPPFPPATLLRLQPRRTHRASRTLQMAAGAVKLITMLRRRSP